MEEVEAANRAAVETCHRVLNLLSQSQEQVLAYKTLVSETAEAVSKFKRVVSLLGDGVGHARVRRLKTLHSPLNHKPLPQSSLLSPTFSSSKPFPRNLLDTNPAPQNNSLDSQVLELNSASRSSLQLGPPAPSTHFQSLQQQQSNQTLQLQQQIRLEAEMLRGSNSGFNLKFDNSSCTATGSSARSSFMSSSLSMDGSVASLDGGRPFHLVGACRSSDNGAPLPPLRRRCSGRGDDGSSKCASRGRCHCSRRRKLRVKRSIRVPAISNRVADIPPDDYSWRKYGQKPIKGSPHPRGYYKCSSMRGCPARKHVERCLEDPSMLTITYEGEHSHTRLLTQSSHA